MNGNFQDVIQEVTGAKEICRKEVIQSLWGGYGQIIRYGLKGSALESVVVKHVVLPEPQNSQRGRRGSLSHERKIKSYEVETAWYKDYAAMCGPACRIPGCFAIERKGAEVLMVLEDLNAAGFAVRKQHIGWEQMKACIDWLADFHATFMGFRPEGLWETGTYWHLETRPEELEVLDDIPLKRAAPLIDRKLKEARFLTLVHGDAKLANFCFSADGQKVAAVDFQYVGAGCGMKDLAYFVGSCLDEIQSEKMESSILDYYFNGLKKSMEKRDVKIDFESLEEEWMALYYVAWADFHRFLKGWSPGHWKINTYSERISSGVVSTLQKEAGK